MTTEELPIVFDREELNATARDLGVRLIVLYGSYAKRRAEPESDLDIAVLGCPADKFWECYTSLSELFRPYSLDMVRLENADALFRHEIMREGVLLYGDPDVFFEYRAYAYRDFVDSADLFALEEALFRRKMDRMKEHLYDTP
jgi:predicted nucleotidyltransferase